MSTYALRPGSESGMRVVDAMTGQTVLLSGRRLDNMSEATALEVIDLLKRLDRQRQDRIESAERRNDIVAIFENSKPNGT